MQQTIRIKTRQRLEVVDVTARVAQAGRAALSSRPRQRAGHLTAGLLGPSESIPVRGSRLRLGTRQGIALVECDGPRDREIVIAVRA